MSQPRPLAIVTGAARRVGRAIAVELARHGFDLVLTFRQNESDAHHSIELARQVSSAVGVTATCSLRRADFNDLAQVQALADDLTRLPRVDAIVHNASIYDRSPLGSITADQALQHYRINALAPLLLTQALAPALRRSTLKGGGAVVCLSDIHVIGRPRKDFTVYSMSKAALAQMVHNLALDLAPQVRVNGIAPGVIAWPENTDPAERRAYEARIPLGRAGTPEDAAGLVRWLILEATYITGEIIRLDGGRWLR